VIYGGGAGGGKTFALLLDPLRHKNVPGFGAMIFRRESVQITNEGGLWDSAMALYPYIGGVPFKSPRVGFKISASKITFSHISRDEDVLSYQGAQIPMLAFDELTHFSRYVFFYMLSRNRSVCGIRPYCRATTNPDADSWVADFIAWWIDQDTGYPIKERAGVLRWFVRIDDDIKWGDSPGELALKYGVPIADAKSMTFIPALATDNTALMAKDPGYLANLKALSRVERERLLGGNWKVRPAAGLYFPRHSVRIINTLPHDIISTVRAWDLAATPATSEQPDPDATAGVKLARTASGRYIVMHCAHLRDQAHTVRQAIRNTAEQDGAACAVSLPQDPGQAGKDQAASMVRFLAGYSVKVRLPSGDKITRCEPFAAQWQAGNVDILEGPWNEAYLSEMEAFPTKGVHDDRVDASSDAFQLVCDKSGPITIMAAQSNRTERHTATMGAW
jgi:predicted phage terminase large subunit-like protein